MPSFLHERETLERWRRLPGLERGPTGTGRAHLTFDDGPDPDATPAVLDALDSAGAQATFFMLGEQVMRHRALAREVAERGHEIALHGFEHRPHDDLSPREARDDLARGVGALEAATGRRPRLHRPPWGRLTEPSLAACEALDLRPVLWSAWGLDWETVPAERIADLVCRDLGEGTIVLLHDSARYAPRASAAPTAEAIPAIAAWAREAGLELGRLPP